MTPASETLLFLPGASGDTTLWQPLSDRLQHPGRRRFVGWPGFGGLPPEPDVNGLADLARRVIADISEPVAILAQSMGGIVAMLAALERPDLVRHLVLSVTSGGIDLSGLSAFDWRPEFRKRNPGLPRWFEEERWDLTDRLLEIRIPVLLLWGDADPISPVAVGERLRQLLPDTELVVVPGGTHDLVRERVEEIVPHVDRHLGKALSESASLPPK
jgi:pimeloyl-ACP methyl ester carboxylesterase